MSLRSAYYESPAEEMELPPHPHMPRQDPKSGEWMYHERVSDGEVHQQFLIYSDVPQVRAHREHREREFADWERRHPPRTARQWCFSSYASVTSYTPKPMLSATGRPLRHASRATVPTYNTDPHENAPGLRRSGRRATLATESQGSVVGCPPMRITNVSNNAAAEAESDEADPNDNSDGDNEDEDDEDGTLLTDLIPAEMLPPKEITFKINEPRLLQIWVPLDTKGDLGRLQAPFTADLSSEDDVRCLNQWKDRMLNRARIRFGLQAWERSEADRGSQAQKRSRGIPYTVAERGWVVARLRQEPDMSLPDIKNVLFPAFQEKYPRTTRTWDAFRTLVIRIRRDRKKDDGANDDATSSKETRTLRRPRRIVEDSSDVELEEGNVDHGEDNPNDEGESRHGNDNEHELQEPGRKRDRRCRDGFRHEALGSG